MPSLWVRWSFPWSLPWFLLARCGLGLILGFTQPPVLAQITPDRTLGSDGSIVRTPDPAQPLDLIEGGTQQQRNLFHSFQDFNVATGRRVYFIAPDAKLDNVLVRVTGGNASQILGQLGMGQFLNGPNGPLSPSNANLFLLNPQGIFVGPNARLDIAGSLLLSTAPALDLGNGQWFSAQPNANQPLLTVGPNVGFSLGNRPLADLEVQGTIQVGSQQSLTLQGQTVLLSGQLTAPGGQIALGGDRLALFDNARLSTSAPGGGGTIQIGNHFPQAPAQSTQAIYVATGAELAANASDRGDGGTIRLWSEASTRAYGQFSATGGPQGGNGGLIDTSGRVFIDVEGIRIDATASALGMPGTWLLDPRNVILTYGGAGGDQFTGDTTRIFTPSADDARVNIGAIEFLLNQGNNVTITTGHANSPGTQAGNITLEGVDGGWGIGVGSPTPRNVTLTLQAANDIILDTASGGFGISATGANRLNVQMEAGNNLQIGGRSQGFGIDTQGGSITLIADRDGNGQGSLSLFRGGLNSEQGAVTLQAGEQILLQRSGVNGFNRTTNAAAPIQLIAPTIRLEESGLNGNTEGSGAGAPIWLQTQVLSLGTRRGETRGSGINTRSFGSGAAGDVVVGSRLSQGQILAPAQLISLENSGLGSQTGPATGLGTNLGRSGDVRLAADQIQLRGSGINTQSRSAGDAGNVTLTTANLQVVANSGVESVTRGNGQGGNVLIDAKGGQVQVVTSGISSRTIGGRGNSGNVTLIADRLLMNQAGGLDTNAGYEDRLTLRTYDPNTSGNAGIITVTVNSLRATNGSGIRSETAGRGNAGQINLTVRDDLLLQNNGNVSTGTFQGSTGQGGRIVANLGSALIGNTSDLKPDDREALLDPTNRSGGFTSASLGTGNAGDIDLTVRGRLILQNAANIQPKDRAGIRLYTLQTGQGGTLRLAAAETRIDNAFISVASQSTGAAGDIFVRGSRLILDNQGQINGNAASVNGGNIDLDLESVLLMRRGSVISTNAGTDRAGGNGGSITVRSPLVLSVPNENADIIANAFSGSGGQVRIAAQSIFGFVPRSRQDLEQLRPTDLDPRQLASNDISAISQVNPNLNGALNLTGLNTDPSRGTDGLPGDLVDRTNQIRNTCHRGRNARDLDRQADRQSDRPTSETTLPTLDLIQEDDQPNQFHVTGRGGLPETPFEPFVDAALPGQWVPLPTEAGAGMGARTGTAIAPPVVDSQMAVGSGVAVQEADRWQVLADGRIRLMTLGYGQGQQTMSNQTGDRDCRGVHSTP